MQIETCTVTDITIYTAQKLTAVQIPVINQFFNINTKGLSTEYKKKLELVTKFENSKQL